MLYHHSHQRKRAAKGGPFSLVRNGTRTHFNAKCRWHLAATSSKTGCNHMTLLRKVSTRVLLPPFHRPPPIGWRSSLVRTRTRTHFNVKCRWHLAATSSKLYCHHTVLPCKTGNRVLLPTFTDCHLLGGAPLWCGGGQFCFMNRNIPLGIIRNENIIESDNSSRSDGTPWS